MSKLKWFLAVILVALTMCLSACGEKDTNTSSSQSTADSISTADSQSNAKQSASQMLETVSAADVSVDEGGASGRSENGAEKDRKNTEGEKDSDEVADAQANDDDTSTGRNDGAAGSQEGGKTNSRTDHDKKDDSQSKDSGVVPTSAPSPRIPEENDNAEVNINDL